jgi:DNA-binding FadR family transcriptional regulator
MQKRKLPKQQLSGRVLEQLYQRIVDGVYQLDQRLPTEPALMQELAVGRSTIREAVQTLAHMGILEVRQGSGTYVRSLPRQAESLNQRLRRARLTEVHEARRVIEVEVACLAARRRTERDLQIMQEALNQREHLRHQHPFESEAFIIADISFHNAIAQAAGNQVLFDVYRSLMETIRPSLLELVEYQQNEQVPTDRLAEHHLQLLQAIYQQDEQATRCHAEALLSEILQTL